MPWNKRMRDAHAGYERTIEGWIDLSDRVCDKGTRVGHSLTRAAVESPLVAPESKALIRLTVGLLLAVFSWILVSCQTPQRARPMGSRPRGAASRVEKRPETLYLKRETLRIKPKDEGSTTGSLWADTEVPRQLLADEKPVRQGEMVSISIPDELQFSPPGGASGAGLNALGTGGKKTAAAGAPGGAGAGGPAAPAGTAGAKGKAAQDANGLPALTDPNTVGVLGELAPAPITNFKMQIVGMEPGGDVFLRGVKTYANSLGEKRNVTLFAKLPARQLNSFEVDARDLTELALTEEVGGQSAEYASTGWDPVVSRKLAGYSPDINAELQALEDVRRELATEQDALKDRARAMSDERTRMQKDRQRGADENQRLKDALLAQKNGDDKKDGAQPPAGGAAPGAAPGTAPGAAAGNAPGTPPGATPPGMAGQGNGPAQQPANAAQAPTGGAR